MPINLLKKYPELLEILHLSSHARTESLMRIFKRDIEENRDFKLFTKPIFPVKKDGKSTMDTLFGHLINKENEESETKARDCFDPDRAQRLHWFKHHVENNSKIDMFSFTDRKDGKDVIRTYLFDQAQKYVIILEPRQEGISLYYIISAYYLNESYGEKSISKKMKNKLPNIY